MHHRAETSLSVSAGTNRLWRPVTAALIAGMLTFLVAFPALAQSPSPAPSPQQSGDLRIFAEPLLAGHVRPGSWTAVRVRVENDGPSISGELRIRGQNQQAAQSRYGVAADLPTNARQEFTLYAQTALFGSRLNVDLVSGETTLASQTVAIKSHDAFTPIVAIIAERPEGVLRDIEQALVNPNVQGSTVIQLRAIDLPSRVEAWAAVDRLVWQDVDASTLTDAQLDALKLWVGAGGRLVVLGGTKGFGPMDAFGDLLPFIPNAAIDVQPADVAALLGAPPSDATTLPGLTGPLTHGTVLARSGEAVVAAEAGYGRGSVVMIGFNPAEPWVGGKAPGEALWHRLIPQSSSAVLNPLQISDDSQIVYALQNLPAIDLPPIEQLFVLLLAYIALIGPINYLILRRLDKREWAWITIPALVVVFAGASYGMGASLKGSDVIVNQIAVVRAAQGTERGIGQAYIGIYSPSRQSFEVSIPGGALLSNPTSMAQTGTETPLDVLFGESSSRLRNFEVGFGVLRGFRAEAPADSPRIEADLQLERGKLTGTVTNASDKKLEHVAVVFSGGAAVLSDLEPNQTKEVELDITTSPFFGFALSEAIFGTTFPRDSATARTLSTRRSVIDQIFPWGSQSAADAPLLLAWSKGPVLDVELPGDEPNRVGDGLFMIPLAMGISADQIFADQMLRRDVVEANAATASVDASSMYLSRGTMTVEVRPARFDGAFAATALELALTQGESRVLRGTGDFVEPLPADEQPPQDDPLSQPGPEPSVSPTPTPADGKGEAEPGMPPIDPDGRGLDPMPDYQLLDRTTGLWVQFPHPSMTQSYRISNPERYVDESGRIQFRFVNSNDAGQFGEDQKYFNLLVRLEGTIQ